MNTSLRRLFDLRHDQDEPEAIDASVRAGVRFAGTNLWVLFFAILVASVGLNVNSTAVIIGAMLISPLMGPIVGLGYGAAINDTALLRQSAKNLATFTALSLVTSMAYFALSPLDTPGSELLARTTPTLWDVLIAAFGGAAGMVALTRRSISNVVPGVAIATALMPPLCTVGFGLANGRWEMSAGAFYLFLINGVFIAASTLAVAKLVRLPQVAAVDAATRARNRVLITAGLVAVLVPSVWLGWRFAQQELFAASAQQMLATLESDSRLAIVGQSVNRAQRRIQVTVVGAEAERELSERAPALLASHGLEGATLVVRRAGAAVDVGQLRQQVQRDVAQALGEQLVRADEARQQAESRVRELQAELDALRQAGQTDPNLLAEAAAQQPLVRGMTVARGQQQIGTAPSRPAVLVQLEVARPLPRGERERLQRWLAVRLGAPEVVVLESAGAGR
jgi:uncharacterized hydrophobic protein (TIGR00271 family)